MRLESNGCVTRREGISTRAQEVPRGQPSILLFRAGPGRPGQGVGFYAGGKLQKVAIQGACRSSSVLRRDELGNHGDHDAVGDPSRGCVEYERGTRTGARRHHPGRCRKLCLRGGSVRRPLLADFRHHDPELDGFGRGPHRPRSHPTSLRAARCPGTISFSFENPHCGQPRSTRHGARWPSRAPRFR